MAPANPAPAEAPVDATELAARVRLSITRLNRLLRQQSDVDLTPTKVAHLATISREGPLTLGDLAAAEQVAPPTVTKIVAELERRGLVTRATDERDRRVSRVAVTAEGRRVLEKARTRKTAWLVRRLAELDEADLAALATAAPVLEALAGTDKR